MSLRVWLPLNGNIENHGVSGLKPVQTAEITYVNGKIGKAMSTGGFNLPASEVSKFYNNKAMSFCFWIYPIGSTSSSVIIGQSGMTAGNNRMFTIFQYPTPNDLHLSWQSNEVTNSTFLNGVLTGVLTANKWTHVSITYDGSKASIYINGIYNTSINGVSTRTSFNYDVPIPNSSLRYLNDLRIYDHCLSPKEVKEISKALICHFPLNRNGEGNDNAIVGTSYQEVQYSYPATGAGYKDYFGQSTVNPATASQYTLSFWAKSTVNGNKVRAHWYNPNTTTKCETNQGIVTTAGDGNVDFTLSTEWKFYWCVYTQSETTAVKRLIFPRMAASDYSSMACRGSGVVSVKCVKLEAGNKATQWKPYNTESLFNTLGFDKDDIIDISGYKRNAKLVGSLSYPEDTPRYDICSKFTKNAYIINSDFGITTEKFTLSFWVNPQTATSQHFIFGTFNSWTNNGLGIYRDTSKLIYQCILRTSAESSYGRVTITTVADTWNLITLVYDGTTFKGYLNGNLVENVTYGSNGSVLNPVFMIGNSKYSNTPASENEEASISDLRFYATDLNASDITELYKIGMSVANNGTVFAHEFIER